MFKKIINIFWKVYFWLWTPFIIFVYYIDFAEGFNVDWKSLDLVITVGSLIALFLYAYKKRLFVASFWKAYFVIYVIWDFYYNLQIRPQWLGHELTADTWIGFLPVIPVMVAFYLYAFRFMKKAPDKTGIHN